MIHLGNGLFRAKKNNNKNKKSYQAMQRHGETLNAHY